MPAAVTWLTAIEQLALTVWVGAVWSIGFLVTPVLFSMLDSRQLAGDIAARLFHLVSYLGITCAVIYLLCVAVAWARTGPRLFVPLLVIAMLGLTLAGEFYVTPKMAALKASVPGDFVPGSDPQVRFAMWHRIASGLFVCNSLLALLAVIFSNRATGARGRCT